MSISLPNCYETSSEGLRFGDDHPNEKLCEGFDVGVVGYEVLVLLAALFGVHSGF